MNRLTSTWWVSSSNLYRKSSLYPLFISGASNRQNLSYKGYKSLITNQEGRDVMAEKKPIVRLYFAKIKQAFYDLSEEEKSAFMRKDRENLDDLGMKAIMMIDCRWSNEEWDYIGVEEWPTKEALEERGKFEKSDLQAFRYVESKTYLGTPESFAEYGKE